jgi:hypothetical protein
MTFLLVTIFSYSIPYLILGIDDILQIINFDKDIYSITLLLEHNIELKIILQNLELASEHNRSLAQILVNNYSTLSLDEAELIIKFSILSKNNLFLLLQEENFDNIDIWSCLAQ